MVATNFNLDRVAQGSKPHEFDRSSDEKAHLEKPAAVFGSDVDFGHSSRAARLERGQGLSVSGHRLAPRVPCCQRLDQNRVSKLGADPEPGITDLTDKIALAAKEFDLLFLAKTHLAEPMGNFGGSGKLLDANGGASDDAAQWAKEWLFWATIFA